MIKIENTKKQDIEIDNLTIKERITRISNEVEVEENGWNDFSEYKYIKPDDLDKALKPLYLKYRLFVHFSLRKSKDGSGNQAVLRIEDVNTETGHQVYTMDVNDITIKGANAAQNAGGLRTYCKKYLLMTAFHISSNEDDFDSGKSQKNEADAKTTVKASAKGNKKDEEDTTLIKKELIELCKEKAKINREAVIEMIKKYDKSGVAPKVKGVENITNLIEELKTITGEEMEDGIKQ